MKEPHTPSVAKERRTPSVVEEQNPPMTHAAIKKARCQERKEQKKIAHLELCVKSVLSCRSIVCGKETAYQCMNDRGVALIPDGIQLNEDIHAAVKHLCEGKYDSKGWDNIFQFIDAKGAPQSGDGKRQQLVYNEDWVFAEDSPRKLWSRYIKHKVARLLKGILTKEISDQYKDPSHTLIRSKRQCANQPWHYDQCFPGSERCEACGNVLPFVILVALEEDMYTFLDVELNGRPTRVCMKMGDVLLVRGDCLHRGTDFKYAPAGKKYHVRGHAYIDPVDFKRQENITYPHDKYSSFLSN